MATFRAPKGTYDLLPPLSETHLAVRAGLADPLRAAGYGYVETPTFEDTGLFERGVGESTDVVSKEMYTFDDKGGRSLTLRPEGTASVVRSAVEHHLDRGSLPVKLWYSGSMYRYERPQAGRYRHFWQVGAEALGLEDPALDAELVQLAVAGYRSLGLTRFRVLLNTLGCRECRPAYREKLLGFLRGLDLDEPTRARAELNPLRMFDDKRPEIADAMTAAPLVVDELCAECRAYHDEVRALLDDVGVAYEDSPRLVRGLDYYTRTTFTFDHPGLGAQSEIGGGGRYDGLAELVGGPRLPGVGWALGVDRTVLALEAEGVTVAAAAVAGAFLVPLGDEARRRAFGLLTELRSVGVEADMAYGGRGLKGAMKAADRSGARYAVIIGERDLAGGVAQVKDLASGEQDAVALTDLVAALKEKL
ncbi:MAG: histidine--tRNA ligase [Streptosporangiales bacterium]|nr:histidine--tRNA ligase [Streptosporangiales bacterium]